MKLIFSEQAWEDYLYWQAHDQKLLERLNTLIRETSRTPFQGIGKPEPRLVYRPTDAGLLIAQCRYHY
jgi:toxin YoeB